MWYEFRWIDWNLEKVARHGLTQAEVEEVVNSARSFTASGEKRRVAGVTRGGKWIQVIYLIDQDALFVIHARPLTPTEASAARRRKR